MIDHIKAIVVTLLVIAGVFAGGVMVGLKLDKNEDYQRWLAANQQPREELKPTQVAVMQMPGRDLGAQPELKSVPGAKPDGVVCVDGVCKLPAPAAESAVAETQAAEKTALPDLTFYDELGDKPHESGGATLMVKKKPLVNRQKTAALLPAERPQAAAQPIAAAEKPELDAGQWELRICSLPEEIKARVERGKLLKVYPRIEIEAVPVKDRGTWYRVKISRLGNLAEAEKIKTQLEALNYSPLLVKLK